MAHLPEESKFDEGVYQLEMTDPVVGGPNGISNSPLRNLANRTRWLKDQLERVAGAKADKDSPGLTGAPTAPAPADSDNSTRLATTGWVRRLVAALAAPIGHVGSRGAAHGEATTTQAGFMSAADKAKLNGVATGAQANAVTSVAGKTGAVTLAVGDVSGALASSHAGAGGNAHAEATTSQAGFMSAADKRKLDTVSAGAGAGAVASVAGRTGAVTLTVADVRGAAPLASPRIQNATFSGDADTNGSPAIRTTGVVDLRQGVALAADPSLQEMHSSRDQLGGLRVRSNPLYKLQIANIGWVRENTVTSINGKRGVINKLAVGDVEGAAPARNPLFTGRISVAAGTVTDLNHESGAKVYVPAKRINDMTAPEAVSKYALQDYAAPKNSPALSGAPTAPTPGNGENSTRIATTAWVWNAIATIADTSGMAVNGHPGAGFIRLPRWLWGVTIQWAYVTSSQRGHLSGAWPIAFANECFMTVGCPRLGSLHAPVATNGNRTHFFYEAPGNVSGHAIGFNIIGIGR